MSAVLRIAPRDPDALQTKMFLLQQTEQYMPALSLIDSLTLQGDVSSSNYEFEKAYSLYRVHREADATGVLEEIKNRDGNENRGVMHLEAQLVCISCGLVSVARAYESTTRPTVRGVIKQHSICTTHCLIPLSLYAFDSAITVLYPDSERPQRSACVGAVRTSLIIGYETFSPHSPACSPAIF